MTRWVILIVGLMGLVAGCTQECVQEACEEASRAQPAGDLEQGITGVIAYRTDACANDCCECSFSMTTLRVYAVDDPIEGTEDAQVRLTDVLDFTRVEANERYAQALAPGRYAVCDQQLETCANIVIEEGDVYTVNIQAVYGPMQMRVFSPEGERLMGAVVGRGAPY